METKVSAVLVAAGSSTRMGFDKLSFDLGGGDGGAAEHPRLCRVPPCGRDRSGGGEEPRLSGTAGRVLPETRAGSGLTSAEAANVIGVQGQPVDRIHPHLQRCAVYGPSAYGSPFGAAMVQHSSDFEFSSSASRGYYAYMKPKRYTTALLNDRINCKMRYSYNIRTTCCTDGICRAASLLPPWRPTAAQPCARD